MAKENNKKNALSVGFYEEPGFVSLTTSLRKLSGDDTIPAGNYVDVYKNMYDLITPDKEPTIVTSGIVDINFNRSTNELIIKYANDTTKTLPLEDDFLFNVFYDNINKSIIFVLKNGTQIPLDIKFLIENYATKEEVNEIKKNITIIQNNIDDINNNIENIVQNEIDEIVEEKINEIIQENLQEEIENVLDNKGVDSVNWQLL